MISRQQILTCNLLLLAAFLGQPLAQAKLVEDHSEFSGTYGLVDGNVKFCTLEYVLEGQPNAMVFGGTTVNVSDKNPEDVPVGQRDTLSRFVSDYVFRSVFVDNIDVPGTLVTITTDYERKDDGGLRVITTNSYPKPPFSAPAQTECLYRKTGYGAGPN